MFFKFLPFSIDANITNNASHRWYKWLEGKFLDLREAFILEKEPKESELTKWNVESDKAIEVREKQQKKKGSLYSRLKKWKANGKNDKEMQRK